MDDVLVHILVEATDIPAAVGVTVGVQPRGRPGELLEPVAAPATRAASWALSCEVRDSDGVPDLTGPCVEGRPGARFVYLSWHRDGEMFRRAKLMLDAVPPEVLRAAIASGRLVARLGLTDPAGGPVCAAVRPPRVTWSA